MPTGEHAQLPNRAGPAVHGPERQEGPAKVPGGQQAAVLGCQRGRQRERGADCRRRQMRSGIKTAKLCI